MPGPRSRQGCTECRRRRRKCDEQKPICGQCSTYDRSCIYTLKVVRSDGLRSNKAPLSNQSHSGGLVAGDSVSPHARHHLHSKSDPATARATDTVSCDRLAGSLLGAASTAREVPVPLPRCLPNGVPVSPRYHRLLNYFTNDILASLSCHPSVHLDLCRGLVPATLYSPQLLSACLALSAAGILSRGISDVDGVAIPQILGHLQTSGLFLLRTALEAGQMNETILATCLVWCLTDVFTYRQGSSSSWRIHLQGIKAILDSNQTHRYFAADSGAAHSAMRHLYLLYLSLQTLPHVPALALTDIPSNQDSMTLESRPNIEDPILGPKIDGFLGYSEELLHIIQKVNQLTRGDTENKGRTQFEADMLLGKLNAMIDRDSQAPLDVAIYSSLSPESNREFELCHRTFQQATTIHVYRRLFHVPSNSPPIQSAVTAISQMVTNMAQGQPCHTWVAMAMPLFTIGCEAFTADQQSFVLDKIDKLDMCIGSYHVRIIRQALEDLWRLRREEGDHDGDMCASKLLEKLQYNIILF
ncbi:fungal-specific transcription factor domain-containing protein [Apiospora arundinis]|uniref:Fungal-specific transcription factor domain-containing protein n=1 Tax=Apiospora arundinis TaxID=335852 RepID=A0ABR2JPK0_9PEZI